MGKWRETFKENCDTAAIVYRLERDPTSATFHDVQVLMRDVMRRQQIQRLPPHKKQCEVCGDTYYTFGAQLHRTRCPADKCLPENVVREFKNAS